MRLRETLSAGTEVGRYRIDAKIGAGGMGDVYKAWDPSLGRSIALKVLPPSVVSDRDRLRRFVLEAKTASSLSHPHIVTIHEIGEATVATEEGAKTTIHFIAMELINGETLRTRLLRADLRTAVGWLAQAADALARTHAAGVVHRDLKPDNIMITHDGYAKLLDFGLAKLIERPPAGGDEVTADAHDRTTDGVIVGTAAYMSPEQVLGQAVDHRSDIFSFGAILYEVASGRRAFHAGSAVDVLHKVVHSHPEPIEQSDRRVPAELRRLIHRCLAKSPDDRLQSMKDIAIALRDVYDDFDELLLRPSSGSVPAPKSGGQRGIRRERVLWIGMAVAVLVIAALATWRLRERPVPNPAVSRERMKMSRITSSGSVVVASISPDGKYLVHDEQDPESGHFSLWVTQIETGSRIRIVQPTPRWVQGVTFSPDQQYVYYTMMESEQSDYAVLYRVPALGGTSQRLVFDIDTAVSFSPDRMQFAFIRASPHKGEFKILTANIDGTQERVVATQQLIGSQFPFSAPAWSPDGRYIAFIKTTASGREIVLHELATGRERRVGRADWQVVVSIVWLPDGTAIVGTAGTFDAAQVWLVETRSGEAMRLTNDNHQYLVLSVTADGRTLLATQDAQNSALVRVPINGGREQRLTARQLVVRGVSVSERGAVITASRDGMSDLWLVDGTSEARQLTTDGSVRWPAQSRDGRWLLFGSLRGGGAWHVWQLDREGGAARQLTNGAGENLCSIAPDGSWFLYSSEGALWGQPLPSGAPWKIPGIMESPNTRELIGPDGESLFAIHWAKAGDGHLRTVPSVFSRKGGAPLATVKADGQPRRWLPSGEGIAFVASPAFRDIWSARIGGTPATPLTRFDAEETFDFDFSPDGKYVYAARGQRTYDAVMIRDFR